MKLTAAIMCFVSAMLMGATAMYEPVSVPTGTIYILGPRKHYILTEQKTERPRSPLPHPGGSPAQSI